MKILIILFAVITFLIMAGDPRSDNVETRDSSFNQKLSKEKPKQEHEDSEESS
ncbi:hypothetical protein [Acinetobacter silvestris]|uniref:ABZJ_00068 family colistin stress protein n=1 Tax=Acinetobacter silvestris TaxID=1977882 RepID=UPI00148A66FB|nr:hypothetical protein [Acinetobacter silvestris]